ncbi:YciI family protein [Kribbella sp. NBC_00709]|uniref:YciI family protein n=1 Tax=Kribbella sp. NBC_00709 TaxID=2975972 RepID=UPI002E27BAED|nr:YciI family protein [Kribbella sp. NBC_00709]
MRYMMIFKASEESEAGGLPSEESLTAMGLVMAEMADKGVLLAGDGLLSSSKGFRLAFDDDKQRRVIDGPFAETKELIAGFCLIEVASREEAIEWGWRCVAADGRTDGQLEIRKVASAEDFGDNFTPEARAREEAAFLKAAENLQKSNT